MVESVQAEMIRRSIIEEDEEVNSHWKGTHYSAKQRFLMRFSEIEE